MESHVEVGGFLGHWTCHVRFDDVSILHRYQERSCHRVTDSDNMFTTSSIAMPPPNLPSIPDRDAKLPLQQWLKLWTDRGVDMRVAMGMAAKM